ncbi:protein INCA1 isoform X2 [Ahaetulla prasina]|uniref:protein INCA1 isoform X2 n=1 Tax=Ahaetulla prasina TaxID=499056 RepID=UPI00264A2270|nr:protein INCA1 isoform X2 [Ahaetulla prasina]
MPQGQAQGSRGVCVTGGAKGCQRRMPKGQEGCPRRRTDPVSRGRGAKRRPQQCHPGSPRWSAETSPRSTPPAIPIARPTFGTGLSSSRGTFHDPGRCPAVQPSGLKEKRGGLGPGRRLLLRKGSRPPRSCVRRRGRVRSRRASDTSVACPSCIIWRRQKAAQEGGALPQLSPQRNGMVRDLPACLLSPARTPEPYARPFLGRGTGAQLLLHPQWNPNLREPRRFSEESPLAFYAVAAHHRSLHAGSTELLRPEE